MELIWEVTILANSYGTYCIGVCQAKCCKHGRLPLSSSEKLLFDESRIDERGTYDLSGGCEYLGDDNRCLIYATRPKICGEFPFILKNRTIYANSFCPGVDEDLFYDPKKITRDHMYIKI